MKMPEAWKELPEGLAMPWRLRVSSQGRVVGPAPLSRGAEDSLLPPDGSGGEESIKSW